MNKKKMLLILAAFALMSTACSKDDKVEINKTSEIEDTEKQEETKDNEKDEEDEPKEDQSKVNEKAKTLTYSNLVDEESKDLVKKALTDAGIKEEKINSFLEDVKNYNDTIENTSLVKSGFETIDSLKPIYDYTIMDKWESSNPDFYGHNCRLTNFRLMDEFIDVKNPIIGDDSMLFAEKEVLESKKLLEKSEEEKFISLYSYVNTDSDLDVNKQIEVFKKSLEDKGVSFKNDKISVVSVVFHMNIEGSEIPPQLFIGHTGLMWEGDNKEIYFLEKISFSEPYQLDKFKNRQELSDYLMNSYDVDTTGSSAIPFVLENGNLIEGFRENPDKTME